MSVRKVNNRFSKEEECLFNLLKAEMADVKFCEYPADINWEELTSIANKHGVLSLLYASLAENERVPVNVRRQVEAHARRTVQQSYHLLFLCKYLVGEFEREKIPTVLLKGVSVANLYPVPELRKSGDVDLMLLNPQSLSAACKVLEKADCILMEKQSALHHVVYQTTDGIEIELHTMLAEPFDNNKINRYIQALPEKCSQNVKWTDIMGAKLPILHKAFQGYELLLHMLQHFLRSGFGLKLLCDWVVFWGGEVEKEEQEKYLQLVNESGIKGFSDLVTLTCCKYLGLEIQKIKWMEPRTQCDMEEFLLEILEAEEFGKSSKDRMVVLRGNGIQDYFREFHHQMLLNFPKAGKCPLCWPVLWMITLVRFIRNNRRIREVSEIAILKKAGQRSKIIKALDLFKNSAHKCL